jgi:hypothetical protein
MYFGSRSRFHVWLYSFRHRLSAIKINQYSKKNGQSSKKFILTYKGDKCLEFEKESKTQYRLSIRYPFSILEAHALACA